MADTTPELVEDTKESILDTLQHELGLSDDDIKMLKNLSRRNLKKLEQAVINYGRACYRNGQGFEEQ